MPLLNDRIEEMCKHADQITAEDWERQGFTFAPPPTHVAHFSTKWSKIYTMEVRGGQTVLSCIYAFVAMQDFTTKQLGAVKTGDIHKPATFTQPAKHARGNVFQADFGDCMTPLGIVYIYR